MATLRVKNFAKLYFNNKLNIIEWSRFKFLYTMNVFCKLDLINDKDMAEAHALLSVLEQEIYLYALIVRKSRKKPRKTRSEHKITDPIIMR